MTIDERTNSFVVSGALQIPLKYVSIKIEISRLPKSVADCIGH